MIVKLLFYNKVTSIKLDDINIFVGCSNSGKTTLANTLSAGLNSGEDNFFVDDLKVLKNKYEVVKVTDNDYLNELKMNSKSTFTTFIKNNLFQFEEPIKESIEKISDAFDMINESIRNHYHYLSDLFNQDVIPKLKINDIANFLLDNITIDNPKSLSNSQNYEIYFFIKAYTPSTKKKIFILDDVEMFDIFQILNFISCAKENNITLLLFTKNSSFVRYLTNYNIYFIHQTNVFSFYQINNILKSTITNEESFLNHTLLQEYEIDNKVNYLLSDYSILLTDLIINNRKNADFFLKNSFSQEIISILTEFLKNLDQYFL